MMEKPHIVCHMTVSLDGKVTGTFLSRPESAPAVEHYYEIHRNWNADGFACGRITMETSFTGGFSPDLSAFADAVIPREDYRADVNAHFFAVAFDRHGSLGWTSARISDEDPGYDNAHILEVLCEDAPDAYLAYLRSIGVSYLFAGTNELNLPLALHKLRNRFGIETLLLEGGSILNGAFQREGLIDELSLVVAPCSADADDLPLFSEGTFAAFTLNGIECDDNGVVWITYRNASQ